MHCENAFVQSISPKQKMQIQNKKGIEKIFFVSSFTFFLLNQTHKKAKEKDSQSKITVNETKKSPLAFFGGSNSFALGWIVNDSGA